MTEHVASYHHGALPDVILAEALQRARREGLDGLSLRGLARTIGVSHAAVYRHFASKAALIRAIGEEGFVRLDRALAACDQADPTARFEALGIAYVQFAVSHRGVYHAMFDRRTYGEGADVPAIAQAPFGRVHASAKALLSAHGRDDVDPLLMALTAWSLMHGVAVLWMNGALTAQTGAQHVTQLAAPVAKLVTRLVGGRADA